MSDGCDLLINQIFSAMRQKGWMLATAESCTGGMIAAAITDKAGSSNILERGFVTYSNQAKMDCLGVSENTLQTYGAVSEHTAKEMAQGALKNSKAHIAISVTGIAGPDGGTDEKPVGLVFIGCCVEGNAPTAIKYHFEGNRASVREQTMQQALKNILSHALS